MFVTCHPNSATGPRANCICRRFVRHCRLVSQFPSIEVGEWDALDIEPMGSKPGKLWLAGPEDGAFAKRKWLFKPRTMQAESAREFTKGDDWAEKIASELAVRLGVPAAPIQLAFRNEQPGIISGDISSGRNLILGNEVLAGQDPEYDLLRRRGVPGYTVRAVFDALRALGVRPPQAAGAVEACDAFAGYLVLDALIANTDRHHENWAIIEGSGADRPELAPTFDHASSLGFQLSDEDRNERLTTRDRGRTLEAFAERGMSRHFAGRPTLLELATTGLAMCRHPSRANYRERVEALDEEAVNTLVEALPDARVSPPSRMFCARLIAINRRRLLDELGDLGRRG